MPVMNEGTPVITVRKHPTISVDVAAETDLRIQREIMSRVPEVVGMMARAGADELGIDPVGLNETDMFLTLAPAKGLARARAWTGSMSQIRAVLDTIPGISYAFSQPIDMRVQEMIIGARGDVVVKVFGDDINELNRIAREVAAAIRKIPGARDVFALQNDGMRYLTARIDRLAAGRFGLNAGEIQDALRVWVDGRQVGLVLEGPIRTPLVIRGAEISRRSAVDFTRLPMVSPDGKVVELSQLADVRAENGPIQVIREEAQRFATILANVTGRDLVGFVDEAKAAVARGGERPSWLQIRMGRPVRKSAARIGSAGDRRAAGVGAHFPAAISDIQLGLPSGPRFLQRPLRRDWRHSRPVGFGRVSFGAGLRRLYRADRHRRSERRRADFLH